jgi:type 1 fimbriae regulatory protein FimB/type 1 fimbriae regulatory protein FimE
MSKLKSQTSFSAKSRRPPPRKPKNIDRRTREFLSESEIDQLRLSARKIGRHSLRDDTIILMLFRHGLRVSEVTSLRWEQVDLKQCLLHVRRRKNGIPATHPLRGPQLRALRQLQRGYPDTPYVFISERRAPLTTRTVSHIISRASVHAKLGLLVHPHMLRHSTGFYLANKGHDTRAIQAYLGHANINNTVIYTKLSPERFKDFWID